MTFIFRNKTIFWNISKWNRGQKKGTEGVLITPTQRDKIWAQIFPKPK